MVPPGPLQALPKEPGKASLCLLPLPEMKEVLDFPPLSGYVSSPETAAGNVVIFFLSSKGKKIESIYYRPDKLDVTIAAAKA